jgi:hypothetical protein
MGLSVRPDTTFGGRTGVWVIYDYDNTAEPSYITPDPVNLLVALAKNGTGHPAFWPFGIPFSEALKWWEAERIKYDSNSAAPSTRGGEQLR